MYLGTGIEPRNLFGDGPPKNSDNHGGQLVGSALTLIIIAIIVVVIRVYCRAHLLHAMGADDYCIIVATVRDYPNPFLPSPVDSNPTLDICSGLGCF